MNKRKMASIAVLLLAVNLAYAGTLQNWIRVGFGAGIEGKTYFANMFDSINSSQYALYNGENETVTFRAFTSRGRIYPKSNPSVTVGTTQLNLPKIVVQTRTSHGHISFLPTPVRFSLVLYKGNLTEIKELAGTATVVADSSNNYQVRLYVPITRSDILELGSNYGNDSEYGSRRI